MALIELREPPSFLKLFGYGQNDTDKGSFELTPDDARRVVAMAAKKGVDIPFDYEHKSIASDAPAGAGKAAGWCQLEARKDGLYATNIKWTAAARSEIAAREWRYVSPVFTTQTRGGKQHVDWVLNIALTNIPATHGASPLVAASNATTAERGPMDPTEIENDDKQPETLAEAPAEDLGAKLDRIEGKLDQLLAMEQAEAEAEPEALAAVDEPPCDDAEKPVAASVGDVPPAMTQQPVPGKKTALSAALQAVTGTADPDAQIGVLHALAAHRDAHKQIAGDSAKRASAARDQLVEGGIKSGKLAPSQRQWALSMSSGSLKAFLDAAPARFPTRAAHAVQVPAAVQPDDGGTIVTLGNGQQVALSADTVRAAQLFGNSLETVALAQIARTANAR